MNSFVRYAAAVTAWIFPVICFAAGRSVSGSVVDLLGVAEPFATLRVFSAADSVKPVVMGVAGEDGAFRLSLSADGDYILRASATGKADASAKFSVTPSRQSVDLGKIVLRNSSNMLGEVEVTAQRPVVTREIDRIGYDVQADADNKTSTLEEMLRKVPMVTVEQDGTIKVKGDTNFKIYRNGRPNNSFTKNAKDIFKAIPASMIKKIEVITDPGAREDAEGSTVVLNIVTLENVAIKGVMGTVSANWSTNSTLPGGNLWLTSQIDRVTFSVSGGANVMSRRQHTQESESRTDYADGSHNISRTKAVGHGLVTWWNGEMSWEPDTLNLFTMDFGGFHYSLRQKTFGTLAMFNPQGEQLYSYTNRGIYDPYGYLDFNGSANYQRLTRRKGEVFTLSYAISTTRQNNEDERFYESTGEGRLPMDYDYQSDDTDLRYVEQTVQADWTRPLSENHKLDVGGKFVHRHNHSVTSLVYQPTDLTVSDDFTHVTTIAALFADYRMKVGRFGARVGARYEFSHLGASYKDKTKPSYGSDFNDIVPNAAVNYEINDANTIKLSYNTSIRRPGISYLNPTVQRYPLNVSYGNPDLKSSFQQSLSLNYNYMGRKVMIDFNAGWSWNNTGVISSSWTDDQNITHSTYVNGGRDQRFYAGAYINWTASSKTSVMLNVNTGYNRQHNPSLGVSSNGWNAMAYLMLRQQLPWKFSLSVTGFGHTGFRSLYSNYTYPGIHFLNYDVSLRRTFLKEDRLSVGLSFNNIGISQSRSRQTTFNNGTRGWSESWTDHNQSVSIQLSWRFGSLNAQVRKTRSITNDDVDGAKF